MLVQYVNKNDWSLKLYKSSEIITQNLWVLHPSGAFGLQSSMRFSQLRKVDINVKLWELGIRPVPKEIVPFISQSENAIGAEFQIRLVGSSGFAALGEPVRVFDYLFNSDDSIRKKFLSSKNVVLDHGCGVGRFSVILAAHGKGKKQMYGVDVLGECVQNYEAIVGAPAGSVLNQEIKDLVGVNFFDATISYSVFTHLPKFKAEECLRDLFAVTKPGGLVVLTIWNERLLGYLDSSSYSSNNGFWWENMKRTLGQYTMDDLSDQGILFAANSRGDGLPSDDYGDTIYSVEFFSKMVERNGWNVKLVLNEDSLTLQTIVVLIKED